MNSRQDSLARGSLVGSRVGRFEIVAEIGSGGMASVYLARAIGSAGFQRAVAVKVMHRHLASEDAFVEMFLDEARVAATIHHPNVVPIVDVGLDDGLIYLVMDYIEGDSFAAIERVAINVRRRIPLNITLRIMLDALAGLHAAHELCGHDGTHLKIIHRDVSPQNIVVGVDGVSRIVDFGIAKAETRITTTKVGTLKGKLNFMAPEQLRGSGLDRRVDVFGAGVTLWEAVTLRRLYPGDSEIEIARRILSGAYNKLTDFDPKLPPALDEVCRKALAVNTEERYATAADFAEDIERRLAGNIATSREVATFISGVASTKLEKERRAMREWLAEHGDAGDDYQEEEDEFETAGAAATVVEMPKKAIAAAIMRRNEASTPAPASGENSGTRRAVRPLPEAESEPPAPFAPVASSQPARRAPARPDARAEADGAPRIPPQAPLPLDLAGDPSAPPENPSYVPERTMAIALVTPRPKSTPPPPDAPPAAGPSSQPHSFGPQGGAPQVAPAAHVPGAAPLAPPLAATPAPPPVAARAGVGVAVYVLLAVAFLSMASAVAWFVLHQR